MVDRFPEAFERFERQVNVGNFDNYRQLAYAFALWAGKRWVDSYLQNLALKREGERLGFKDAKIPDYFERIKPRVTVFKRRGRAVRRRKWKRKVRITRVKKSVRWYVGRKYSANKIQRLLKKRGIGIRRKTLLRYVREFKGKSVKANREKYIPKKYRKKHRKKYRK
jgi:hypothetical protein